MAESVSAVVAPSGDSRLSGVGASSGKMTGRVRIAYSPDDASGIGRDEVLVCSGTDFNFMAVMQRCGGVVTEEGGVLSHAAVICRELAIPCVVGASAATTVLNDGDRIAIDGADGTIAVIQRLSCAGTEIVEVDPTTEAVGGKASRLRELQMSGAPVYALVLEF